MTKRTTSRSMEPPQPIGRRVSIRSYLQKPGATSPPSRHRPDATVWDVGRRIIRVHLEVVKAVEPGTDAAPPRSM